jgi:hypothetical protein
MDDDLLQEMIRDLHDAIGHQPIPEHAAHMSELQRISGLGYDHTRKAVVELIKSGKWKKQRKGNKTLYWKVKGGTNG